MQLELGKIYEGKVTGIKDYGAFVEIIGENATGMVHISQISNEYVTNAKDHLTEGQIVKVKFMGTNEDGKIKLSIKEALPPEQRKYNQQSRRGNYGNNNYQRRNNNNNNNNNRGGGYNGNRNNNNNNNNRGGNGNNNYSNTSDSMFSRKSESDNFEDMLNKFKQHSDENLNDLKRITDRRNRTRRK
jgi:S1 RNA binding domain protein